MNRAANVKSIEHIRDLRVGLVKFEETSRDAVTLLAMEVRRATEWIETDRRRYWPVQVKKASQKLAERRSELQRCQSSYGADEAPPCFEQKKAYQRARDRLRYCEDQVRVTKRWIRMIRQELTEFEGQMAQMTTMLDMDLPRALTTLARMLNALEKYAHGREALNDAAAGTSHAKDAAPESETTSSENTA